MQTIKKRIAEKVLLGVQKVNPATVLTAEEIAGMLEYPPDPAMGDLAFPCFRLSRELRRSPVQIASALKEDLTDDCIGSVEVAGGYLNIRISNDYLGQSVVPEILEKGERYGAQTFEIGRAHV